MPTEWKFKFYKRKTACLIYFTIEKYFLIYYKTWHFNSNANHQKQKDKVEHQSLYNYNNEKTLWLITMFVNFMDLWTACKNSIGFRGILTTRQPENKAPMAFLNTQRKRLSLQFAWTINLYLSRRAILPLLLLAIESRSK